MVNACQLHRAVHSNIPFITFAEKLGGDIWASPGFM
jgi:hypothetical protein